MPPDVGLTECLKLRNFFDPDTYIPNQKFEFKTFGLIFLVLRMMMKLILLLIVFKIVVLL
jgi:hypothetical protein